MIAPGDHHEPDAIANVTEVTFQAARPELVETGLLGWVQFSVVCLRVEGVTLRRTADGRYALAFPVRRLVRSHKSYYVAPLDDRARRHIEHQVFDALNLEAGVRT